MALLRSSIPKAAPGGEMPLMDHLRELRTRIIRAVLSIVAGTAVAWFLYQHLLNFLFRPYRDAAPELRARGVRTELTILGLGAPFQLQMQVSLIAGLIISSPLWVWQLWAFVLPALHRHERRAVVMLTAASGPLFVAGVALTYWILPKTLLILGNFTPEGGSNLLTASSYLQFVIRMSLLFGLAAQLPVAVVLLNRLGVVHHEQLKRARPWIIVAIFIFAAVATPTPDPFTMNFVAVPMTILYLIAEQLVRFTDRRRARDGSQLDALDPTTIDDPEPV